MAGTIYFYYKAEFLDVKVNDIISYDFLPVKIYTIEFLFMNLEPKGDFRYYAGFSECFCPACQ